MKRSFSLLAALAPLVLLAPPAAALDLPNFDAALTAPALSAAPRAPGRPAAFVASKDAKRGVPSFLWIGRNAGAPEPRADWSAEGAALEALRTFAPEHGLGPDALLTAKVVHTHDLGHGAIVVVVRQEVGGVEVFRGDAKVVLTQAREPVAIAGALHPAARPSFVPVFAIAHETALVRAIGDATGVVLGEGDLAPRAQADDDFAWFDLAPGASAQSGLRFASGLRAKKVLYPLPDRLVPAYYVEVMGGAPGAKGSDAHGYVIDAADGAILLREDLVHYDAFTYRVYADATGDHRPADGPIADWTPYPHPAPDGSYPPFAQSVSIQIDGFNKTHDPWLPVGATETSGNNVDCYTDDDMPDGFSPGDLRAAVSSPGVFDYTFDTSAGPQSSDTQKMAALTDLFYVTNWLHDYWYDAGFDEKAKNAQLVNYGRGGFGNDPLHAEGQDGAPGTRNNSNMAVPQDGVSPRMQMYVWNGPTSSSVGVEPLNQSYANGRAGFGPSDFDTTGTVALVDDGTAPVTDACEAIQNDVTGKIALVDRGMCTFKQKVVNAAAAGAIGVILVDNKPNEPPPGMPDADPMGPVSIPVLSISLADGDALKAALQSGAVTAHLTRVSSPDRDGTIDNSVIAHEWGHYLHLRQVACGAPICNAESEGWADFNALMTTLRPGDDTNGAFPIAQYATAAFPDDPAYFGIRRYPYSTDMQKNPLTFKDITSGQALPSGPPVAQSTAMNDNAEAHSAGEIWASMLFEGLVALVERSKAANPPYDFEGARRRMSEYVVAGLKAAPTNPTYLEQRDAILAAAFATDKDDFLALAHGFAKRGAGTCAVAPARESTDFQGVVESFVVEANASFVSLTLDDAGAACDKDGILDAGETGKLHVELVNNGTGVLQGASLKLETTAKGLSFPGGTTIPLPDLMPFAVAKLDVDAVLDRTADDLERLDVKATIDAKEGCAASEARETAPIGNADIAPKSATKDGFEVGKSVWLTLGDQPKAVWSLDEVSPGEHAWRGIDLGSNSDTQLVSPSVDVSVTEDLIVSFDHRHQFEDGMGTHWDGAVVEVSVAGGAWEDVSKYANPGYGGKIGDAQDQAHNPLNGRQGYVAQNASWPKRDTVKLDFKKALAGKSIKLRFRAGSDDAAGAFGWEIDNVDFQGITNKPFTAAIQNAKSCVAVVADAGKDQTVTSGDTVKLDGSKSEGDGRAPIVFAWSESDGPMITLAGADTATPTFVAPDVTAPTPIVLGLDVTEGAKAAMASVTITVQPKPASPAPSHHGTLEPHADCLCSAPGGDATGDGSGLAIAALGAAIALERRRRRSS